MPPRRRTCVFGGTGAGSAAEDQSRAERLCALRPAAPWNIIAITFTNKAANELKTRLEAAVGPRAYDVWAMTFHSACCRILRREIERLGYSRSFTIYDTSDSERIMKDIIKSMGLDDKSFPAKSVLSMIGRVKDRRRPRKPLPGRPRPEGITGWRK